MELYFCYALWCDLADHDNRDSPGPRRHSEVLYAIKPQWWRQRQAGEDVGVTYTYSMSQAGKENNVNVSFRRSRMHQVRSMERGQSMGELEH